MGRHARTDLAGTPDPETTDPETTDPETADPEDVTSVASARVALRLRGVRKSFRTGLFGRGPRVDALNGIDLTVPAGTVHALLGPNGAGKTTTVRAVATLMRPDAGTVQVGDIDAVADPDSARKIIGVSGQYAAVDGNLTGFENLRLVAQLYGLSRAEASSRARELIADLDLTDAADRPMRTYSGGMRRRLDLAGALINDPTLVILDEPTTGLDPRGRRQMWEVIARQVASGATVLLTTQYLEEADALADEITVIDRGVVRAQGSAAELKATTARSILTVEIAPGRDGDDAGVIATTLAEVGLGMPESLDDRRWSVPVTEGTRSAVAAVLALESAGVDVEDAAVTEPTLDEVFLSLTGQVDAGGDAADRDPTEGGSPLNARTDRDGTGSAREDSPAPTRQHDHERSHIDVH